MRNLLITGGTGDLGSVVVPWLAREHRCIVMLRSAADLSRLPRHANIAAVDSPDDLASYAPIYGVVSLAGAFKGGSDAAELTRLLDANLFSFVRAFEAALPHMHDGGRIVAISSAASLRLPAGLAAYNASKAALNAFVRTIATDLRPRAITANALLPTALDTPAMRESMARAELVPLDRVAEWIGFLLSDAGAGVTGQLIELAG